MEDSTFGDAATAAGYPEHLPRTKPFAQTFCAGWTQDGDSGILRAKDAWLERMFGIQLWLTKRRLAAKSPQTRLRAVQKLRPRGRLAVLFVLARVLEDPDPKVRAEARKAMREGLQEAPEAMQLEVVEALKAYGGRLGRNALVIALRAGAASARWQAAQALKALGWTPRNSSEELAFHLAVGDLEKAAAAGPAAIAPLIRILREGSYQHKVAAANFLGQFDEPEAMPPLIAALKDPDVIVRSAAARALGRCKHQEAVEALLVALKDVEANVRAAAAEALGFIKDTRSVEQLIALLEDKEWQVRTAALDSLGRLHDPRALEPIMARLRDPDAEVRQHAADSLSALGDESCIENLVLVALDGHAAVRQAALRGLSRLSRDWQVSDGAQKALPEIQIALQHKDAGVQNAATALLSRITGMTPFAFAEAAGRAAEERRQATAAQLLADLLHHANRVVRLASAQALGRIALPICAEALQGSVNDPDPFVQAAARSVLDALRRRTRRSANE
jgi:HEAT repeat protein